jgi:hypothetical protein
LLPPLERTERASTLDGSITARRARFIASPRARTEQASGATDRVGAVAELEGAVT